MFVLKTLYLPYVLEKDLKKGYRVIVDEEEAWGFVSLYLYRTFRRRRFLFGKYEKISEIYVLNYPLLMKCYNDKCYFFDIENNVLIKDYGIIGSLAILSTYSSLTPYFTDSIDLSYSFNNDFNIDENYSIPPLKSGEGIYRLTYICVNFENKESRLIIQPPIYYIPPIALYSDFVIREFSEFKRIPIDPKLISKRYVHANIDKYEFYRRILVKAKTGLEKLVDKKLIEPRDVLKIMLMYD